MCYLLSRVLDRKRASPLRRPIGGDTGGSLSTRLPHSLPSPPPELLAGSPASSEESGGETISSSPPPTLSVLPLAPLSVLQRHGLDRRSDPRRSWPDSHGWWADLRSWRLCRPRRRLTRRLGVGLGGGGGSSLGCPVPHGAALRACTGTVFVPRRLGIGLGGGTCRGAMVKCQLRPLCPNARHVGLSIRVRVSFP